MNRLLILRLLMLLTLLRNLLLKSGKLGQGIVEHGSIPAWLSQSIRWLSRKSNMAFVIVGEH